MSDIYQADRHNGAPEPYKWTKDFIEKFFKVAKASQNFDYYGGDTQYIYTVLKKFNLTGQSGMVIGSQDPWVEAILIVHGGVKKVITIEYNEIISEHPQIGYIHPVEMAKSYKENDPNFIHDFAFSFSSLEHPGLGRYGDHLDPEGDLKELQKLHCLVKDGGLVFVGLPMGKDHIYFNIHRVFGKWRLPLIAANYEILGLYTTQQIEDVFGYLERNLQDQPILVLRVNKNKLCSG